MAKLWTFEAGFCTHPGCVALKGTGLRVCRFPARAWLLETRGGNWLWDTGYASHFYDHTRSGVFAWYRRVTPVHFDAGEALKAQLAASGLGARDIKGLILSHFHGDHIAGLRDFPTTPVWCSGQGWAVTRHLSGVGALRKGFVPGLVPPDVESRLSFLESLPWVALPPELTPFEHGYALPGSEGEVFLVDLPGHAAGHIGAFVLTESGWCLLAADAAWSPQGYRQRRGPGALAHLIMEDRQAYYATLDKLHRLDGNGHGVEIRLTHEGDL